MANHASRLRWVLGLTGVVVVVLVTYTGYQALQARAALETVAADFEQLAEELKTGDTAAARETLRSAQAAAADASDNTTGPGWWLTRALPGVGDDVVAVRTVADVTDVLAADVLPSVVTASETLDPAALRPKNGRVRLQPLIDVAPSVVRADEQLQEQVDRVAELRPVDLNPQLAEPVSLMQDKLGEAASLSSKASYALRLLPTMLGAEGPRTYLVLFQNNAEVRATGGIPGAFATITADDGRIALGAQGSAADIGMLEKPPLPLTEEELALFQEKMGLFAQNVNFTPDFPRTAELARAMWESKAGRSVDGVVSTDPVALSYLLGGTGPVRIGAGQTLTADNAVQLLLNEIYLEQPDPLRQNLFFAQAARAVFEAVSSGQGDPPAVLDGLARAGSESRLLVWSADEGEQRLLDETALSGRLPDRAARRRTSGSSSTTAPAPRCSTTSTTRSRSCPPAATARAGSGCACPCACGPRRPRTPASFRCR